MCVFVCTADAAMTVAKMGPFQKGTGPVVPDAVVEVVDVVLAADEVCCGSCV